MTLKSRNNVYFFFVILFAIITVISLVFFTVLSVQKKINIFSDFDYSSIKSILFYPNTSSAYFSLNLSQNLISSRLNMSFSNAE